MRIYAFIHKYSQDVRIVTRDRKTLLWDIPKDQYISIMKVPPDRKNAKDILKLAVRLGKHLKPEKFGKGHQSFVWSRGFWSKLGVLEFKKGETF